MSTQPLLEIRDLRKHFLIHKKGILLKKPIGVVHAVDGVSLDIHQGENVGLVGESGCGKTTLGKTLMYIEEPLSGRVIFDGIDVFDAFRSKDAEKIRKIRRGIQMVFQNPYTSINLSPRVRGKTRFMNSYVWLTWKSITLSAIHTNLVEDNDSG